MEWLYLLIAGAFEIGWPLGFKLSESGNWLFWILFSLISLAISSLFLWMAQKTIPIGTAYAVWTGIGAVGTFLIGLVFFKDPLTLARCLSALAILIGVIGLKLSH